MSQQIQTQNPGQYKISKWLYRPYQLLFFDTEDIAVIAVFVSIAFIFGGWFLWILAFVGVYLILNEKKKRGRGFIKHLLYKAGIFKFKGCPSVFERKFFE